MMINGPRNAWVEGHGKLSPYPAPDLTEETGAVSEVHVWGNGRGGQTGADIDGIEVVGWRQGARRMHRTGCWRCTRRRATASGAWA